MNQPTCTFKKGITYSSTKHPDCGRKHYKNGMCVLHLEKQAADEGLEEVKQIESDFLETITKEIEFAESALPNHELDWSGVHFPAFKFDKWVFPRRVLLAAAHFEHGTSFSGCRFSGGLKVIKSKFLGAKNSFNFDKCHFDDETFFQATALGEKPLLKGCIFNKKVTFENCPLHTADFSNNIFQDGMAYFLGELSGQCDLLTCEFHGEINFDSPEIAYSCSFKFRESKFFGKLTFSAPRNPDPVKCINLDFTDVKVHEKASLTFENLELVSTSFERLELFDGASLRFNDMIFGEGNFNDIEQRDKTAVSFTNAELSNTTFLNTNIEKFNFKDSTWCSIVDRKGQGLISENNLKVEITELIYSSESNKDIMVAQDRLLEKVNLILENYRQLVKNSDARRDYALAENFHIGEMEMQRQKGLINGAKHRGLMRKLRSWNGFSIYKFISKYGTSYQHSLAILVGMILFMALLFLLSGLTDTECKKNLCAQEGTCNIQMTLILTPDKPFVGFESMGVALLYTLGVATLQKDTLYKPATTLGEFLRIFTILLVTGQAALTLFAVRRQFRRGGGSGE